MQKFVQENGRITVEQKKVLAELRKIILPVRDSLKEITTGESSFINEKYFNYFNDVYDHIKGIVEHLDNQREMLTSLMERMASIPCGLPGIKDRDSGINGATVEGLYIVEFQGAS